jgi:hypothetical protein
LASFSLSALAALGKQKLLGWQQNQLHLLALAVVAVVAAVAAEHRPVPAPVVGVDWKHSRPTWSGLVRTPERV